MPMLDDLPVLDPPDRDAADPDVLAGPRIAEVLALMFAVRGHASGNLVTLGYEVFDHVIAGRRPRRMPGRPGSSGSGSVSVPGTGCAQRSPAERRRRTTRGS